jgi:hypothetical protein
MINIIIFSFNRAAQCELFLRSMKKYFKEYNNFKINVLYKYSDNFYKKGYEKLKGIYPEINFILENNFKVDLLSLINITNEYTIFFVDDMVWKNPFTLNCDEFEIFKNDKDILTFSLRLHPKLNYCYTANVKMNPIPYKIWKWYGLPGDYGYPMSLDAHFFRTNDIINHLKNLQYNNPNQLESILAMYPLNKSKMICCEDSFLFNNPINKVQINNPNRHGNITAEFLNTQFLNNYFIDLSVFDGLKNDSCHKEVSIEFVKQDTL